MKKSIIALGFALASFASFAQTKVTLDNSGDYVAMASAPDSASYKPTGGYLKEKSGERLPVYVSKKGKEFVFCTSKKTGKTYKKYIVK
jgi:hypothetical protein